MQAEQQLDEQVQDLRRKLADALHLQTLVARKMPLAKAYLRALARAPTPVDPIISGWVDQHNQLHGLSTGTGTGSGSGSGPGPSQP